MSSNTGLQIWSAGAFAGVSINLLVFPLDTLKTRLQSPSFQQTYRTAGGGFDRALWRGLYPGIGTVTLVAVPSSGIFFISYEGLKYLLGASSSSTGFLPQPVAHAVSSSVAQLANCAVVTPAEVLKQNAQMLAVPSGAPDSSRGRSKGMLTSSTVGVILQQLKRHPTRLWRGYTALVARDLPFTALQFPAFEYLRDNLMAWRARSRHGGRPVQGIFERAWISALSGSMAGSAAAWVTTPFDVVKTRMMLEVGAKDSFTAERGSGKALVVDDSQRPRLGERGSGIQIGKEVLRKEGVIGLFRGGLVRTAFTVVGNGLFMGCYEGAKCYLREREKGTEEDEP